MTTNYPLGDFLIRVKNAGRAGRASLTVPSTKLIRAVAQVLKDEGYFREVVENENNLDIVLAYSRKKPVLMDLKLISKLGLRIYQDVDKLKSHRGAGFLIVSTPKGIRSHKKAIKENVGGEVIAEVW
jgi:small subunit ribosomal protein S8